MQIKEVCRRTGLTERAVRFYVEKGLLSPKKTWRNGREYLDFSEEDLRSLGRIAGLRRRFFPLEEIKTMQTRPKQIGQVLNAYCTGLQAETKERQTALSLTEAIRDEEIPDLETLCRLLNREAGHRDPIQMDIRPDFRRLDGDSPEERETALEEWSKQEQKRKKKVRFRFLLGGILSLLFLSAGLGGYGAWHYNNRQGASIFTSLWEVEVTGKGITPAEQGQEALYWLDVELPSAEAEALDIPAAFRLNLSGDSANAVWNGAVYEHPYPMARLQIFLPNRWLKAAGLTGTTDLNVLIHAALSDPEAREECVRLNGFQGEYD